MFAYILALCTSSKLNTRNKECILCNVRTHAQRIPSARSEAAAGNCTVHMRPQESHGNGTPELLYVYTVHNAINRRRSARVGSMNTTPHALSNVKVLCILATATRRLHSEDNRMMGTIRSGTIINELCVLV